MNMEGHISRAYDGDLAAFHMQVLAMGGLVLEQVRAATAAFTAWDTVAARLVIDRDHEVDGGDFGVADAAQTLIARRQPAA